MRKLFTEGISARDIAEPLRSFDGGTDAGEVLAVMRASGLEVAGVRRDGLVTRFVVQGDLGAGHCEEHARRFEAAVTVEENASLPEVLGVLAESPHCFVTLLGHAGALITRADIQKPPVRMWLFGMITIIEMFLARTVEESYPNDSWTARLSPGRLHKAEALRAERQRRGQAARLVDCLQFSDRAEILVKDPARRSEFGFESKRESERMIKQMESLRNNLAHAQDILAHDWDAIIMISKRLDRVMTRV
jgi:hypothetical protein